MRVLSLGAGVQSSTLALMIEKGEVPMVDCAIFSDTQAEPDYVYNYLYKLKKLVSYPIHIVTAGDLGEDSLNDPFVKLPVYILDLETGVVGFGRRQCTREYKITPIIKKIRELAGLKKYQRIPVDFKVSMLMGISRDEMQRATENREKWITNDYPLVFDKKFNRGDCIEWLKSHNHPMPKKSACTFCPYHSNDFWLDIKNNDKEMWKEVVEVDRKIRNATRKPEDEVFLHKSYMPLEEADLDPNKDQMDMFNDICDEGMCGV